MCYVDAGHGGPVEEGMSETKAEGLNGDTCWVHGWISAGSWVPLVVHQEKHL